MSVARAAELVARARRGVALTGAGISAESGIPTFRGTGGYWRNLDPTKLATQSAFDSDPDLVWQWYRERRAMIRRAEPNAAHRAVARLSAGADEFFLLTQNVDDTIQNAPFHVFHIHTNPFQVRQAGTAELPKPWVWADSITLQDVDKGKVVIRQRFEQRIRGLGEVRHADNPRDADGRSPRRTSRRRDARHSYVIDLH